MSFVELMLGWGILAILAIGSIVAADPFWGPRRFRRSRAVRESQGQRSDTRHPG